MYYTRHTTHETRDTRHENEQHSIKICASAINPERQENPNKNVDEITRSIQE